MDWQRLKADVIAYAKAIGIDKIGFAAADPFVELKARLIEHRRKGYESGFEEPDLDKRTDPSRSLPDARSLIAVAMAYPSRMDSPPKSVPGAYRGILCRAAWGEDYHVVLRERLERLAAFLRSRVPDARCVVMVDTGPLVDRAVAERAGLGWVGKNTALITPEFGSWVYLGELVTNLPFPPDTPVTEQCGDCTACLDACPTGALVGPGQLNSQACLAYLTQVKTPIPEPFRDKLGNRLYGCDTCQVVCPHNRKKHADHHPEFRPDPEVAKPLLKPLLFMGKKAFQRRFGRSSAAWRGKKPLQRNAILALAHFRDASAIPDLLILAERDERPVIRGAAAWALGKIGAAVDEKTRAGLQEALASLAAREPDEEVRRELRRALDRLTKAAATVMGRSANRDAAKNGAPRGTDLFEERTERRNRP